MGAIMLELALAPLHMGALHPVEKALVLLVAFGPFLVLFVVVYVVRRRDIAEEEAELSAEEGPAATAGPSTTVERRADS
jgi:hypothetical protein